MSSLDAHRGLPGASALLFAASAAATAMWCGSMSAMPGMEMPGGWDAAVAGAHALAVPGCATERLIA